MNLNYTLKPGTRNLLFGLMAMGVLGLVYAFLAHVPGQRVWANLLVNSYFFLGISVVGTLFVAIQYMAEAGWSAGFQRVPEAIGQFIPVAGLILLLVLIAGSHSLHLHHLYHWMDPSLTDPASDHYDEIIAGKSAYLNEPFFYARAVIYILGWFLITRAIRKASLAEDAEGGLRNYKKNVTLGAAFIIFYGVTSSTSAWDWVMSIDTHWFSTLFGWYNFSTFWVTCLTLIALFSIHLKNNGYFTHVNENHLHDLGKFMFAFSIFWTYLWFSQYMLYWYSNIPEEVTYFMDRFENYKVPFLATLVLNFLAPLLLFMGRDAKRKQVVMSMIGVIIIIGHWLDVFVMIMPGTVKDGWGIGILEIGMFLGFLGAFLFVVLTALSKASLVPKHHPFLNEAEHHHI